MTAYVVADAALADVDRLVASAADYLARRLGGTPPLDANALPTDAGEALAAIDAWAGEGAANWRSELTRWFEAHAPVHLVPDPELNGALRAAAKAGTRLAVASALPAVPLDLELQHLGCARAFTAACAGDGSLADAVSLARAALDDDAAPVLGSRAELLAALA